jgi:hypothetical protein
MSKLLPDVSLPNSPSFVCIRLLFWKIRNGKVRLVASVRESQEKTQLRNTKENTVDI